MKLKKLKGYINRLLRNYFKTWFQSTLTHSIALLQEITQFLQFVKSIYNELPNHLNKIFEPRAPIKVRDIMNILNNSILRATDFTNLKGVLIKTCTFVKRTSNRSYEGQNQMNDLFTYMSKVSNGFRILAKIHGFKGH